MIGNTVCPSINDKNLGFVWLFVPVKLFVENGQRGLCSIFRFCVNTSREVSGNILAAYSRSMVLFASDNTVILEQSLDMAWSQLVLLLFCY